MATTSISTESVLVTLACPHFAVFPASGYRIFNKAVAQEHTKTWKVLLLTHSNVQWSLDALWKCSPSILISMHSTCGRADCSEHSKSRRAEHEKILVGLKSFWDTRRAMYLQLGEEYFDLLPFFPASAINGGTCLMAHQQFTIETRHWSQDPFFKSWQKAATALEAAASIALQFPEASTRDTLRYLVRGSSDLRQLICDVWKLRELVNEHAARPEAPDSMTEGLLQRRRYSVQRGIEDIESPKQVYSVVARKRCEKRMVGFERFDFSLVFVQAPEPMERPDWNDVSQQVYVHDAGGPT